MKGSANAGKMDSETAAMLVNTVRMLDARLQNLETPKTDGVIWGASKDEQNRIYNLEEKLKVLQDEVTAVKTQVPEIEHLFEKVKELDELVQHVRSDVETEKTTSRYLASTLNQVGYSHQYIKSSLTDIEHGVKEMKMRMDHMEDEFNSLVFEDGPHKFPPGPAEPSPGVPYTPPPDLPPLPSMAPPGVSRKLRAQKI
jgi:chromosome segregation ATPase